MSAAPSVLCKDCKHHKPEDWGADCHRTAKTAEVSLTSGMPMSIKGRRFAYLERYPILPLPWHCGKKGRYFEVKA